MAVVTSLWTMFAVAFLAATVLPIGSEPLFVALVRLHPEQVPALLAVATLGNTLGGMTSYALGRFVAGRVAPEMVFKLGLRISFHNFERLRWAIIAGFPVALR